jgi:hypothetical protein
MPMSEQQPRVGDIVHYVSHGTPIRSDGSQAYASTCRAAIVTEVGPGLLLDAELTPGWRDSEPDDVVGLYVINPSGTFHKRAAYDEGATHAVRPGPGYLCDERAHESGSWHWPAS